jgi:hypothetical protein
MVVPGRKAAAQPTVTLGWNPETNSMVAGYKLYFGNASQEYTTVMDVGTNVTALVTNLTQFTNYYFTVTSYAADGTESDPAPEVNLATIPEFFASQPMGDTNGIRNLEFSDDTSFGYFGFVGYPWIYHVDMGYEYFFDANDGKGGGYFYDNSSETFWYSNPSIFPIIYDFALENWLYYYPDDKNPGHYTSNPRYFYDYETEKVISL